MVNYFHGLDFLLIFLYFVILVLIGYSSSKKQSDEDFLIAERKLDTLNTMTTINASKTGSILMTFVAFVYLWGIAAIWYFIGVIVGMFVFLPFAMKLKENSHDKFYTLADYFKYNYGSKIATLVSLFTIFLMFGFLILNLIAGTKIFTFFTGWPFWLGAIIMIFIVLSYLLMGGFRAVAKTDTLQYFIIIFMMVVLSVTLFRGSFIPLSEWNLFNVEIWTVMGFFIIGILFPFASPDLWQRVYSSKGKRELKNGIILSVIVYFIVAFLLGLVALTVKAFFPSIDADVALIYGFAYLLPPGLLGLSVVLLFAAIMSSIDTYLFTGASAAIQDFFDWGRHKTVSGIKKVAFLFAILAIMISIFIQNLVISAYIFSSFILVLSTIVISTWIIKRIKQTTLVIGILFGFFSIVFILIYGGLFLEGITPSLVILGLISTVIGLEVGEIVSYFRRED